MKAFRFLIVLIVVAVGVSSFNVDAKKRKTRKRAAKAKVVEPAPTNYDYVLTTTTDDNIYDEVKYPPEYPGGTAGLQKFLADNIRYPESAKKDMTQGTVILQFVVEKDGSISNVKVLKSADKRLDAEALRVVSQITRFVPGYNEDHAPVRVTYTLPVKFKLQ